MTAPLGPDARRAAGRSGTTPARSGASGSAPQASSAPTTVVPTGSSRRPPPRPAAPRPADAPTTSSRPVGRARKARLALKRLDPWSVFVFTLLASVFFGIALVVAVAALYAVIDGLGVVASVNELFGEVTGGDDGASGALITSGRVVGGAAVLAAANVVLLTLLATLGALLYNLCASFTGGIELTLGERDG